MSLTAHGGVPIWIFVEAASDDPAAAGVFTLNVTYTPQVCGDGVTTGTEECDDSALVDGATADAAGAFTLGVQYVVTP